MPLPPPTGRLGLSRPDRDLDVTQIVDALIQYADVLDEQVEIWLVGQAPPPVSVPLGKIALRPMGLSLGDGCQVWIARGVDEGTGSMRGWQLVGGTSMWGALAAVPDSGWNIGDVEVRAEGHQVRLRGSASHAGPPGAPNTPGVATTIGDLPDAFSPQEVTRVPVSVEQEGEVRFAQVTVDPTGNISLLGHEGGVATTVHLDNVTFALKL